MTYLKKFDPRIKVYLSDGSYCEFASVDGTTGIYATNDPRIERELKKAMADGRGAMEEISQAEYQSLEEQKKNSKPLPPKSREEFGLKTAALPPTSGRPQGTPPVPPPAPQVVAGHAVAAEPNRPQTRGSIKK